MRKTTKIVNKNKLSDREGFIESQELYLEEMFSLTTGEDIARNEFMGLAIETYDSIEKAKNEALTSGDIVAQRVLHHYGIYKVDPVSAFNFVQQIWSHQFVKPALVQRWKNWKENYPSLLTRNPRLELHDILCNISEEIDCSSWPSGYELKIRDWLDSGNKSSITTCSGGEVKIHAYYDRLQVLRNQVDGWIVKDYDANPGKQIVFIPDADDKDER